MLTLFQVEEVIPEEPEAPKEEIQPDEPSLVVEESPIPVVEDLLVVEQVPEPAVSICHVILP